MFKLKKVKILYIVMITVFSVTFSIGIFDNPNFNLQDFCLNLSTEFLGMCFALIIVEAYVKEKNK